MSKGEIFDEEAELKLTPAASARLGKLLNLYAEEWRAGGRQILTPQAQAAADRELDVLVGEARETLRTLGLQNPKGLQGAGG